MLGGGIQASCLRRRSGKPVLAAGGQPEAALGAEAQPTGTPMGNFNSFLPLATSNPGHPLLGASRQEGASWAERHGSYGVIMADQKHHLAAATSQIRARLSFPAVARRSPSGLNATA